MEATHTAEAWRRYRSRLRAFFRARAATPEDAEDLLQEVFVRLHTGLCCLEEWPSLERFVYRVARNLLVDRHRSRRDTEEVGEATGGAGSGTSLGAISGALTVVRGRVVALVVAVLWAGAIAAGWAFDLLRAAGLA